MANFFLFTLKTFSNLPHMGLSLPIVMFLTKGQYLKKNNNPVQAKSC